MRFRVVLKVDIEFTIQYVGVVNSIYRVINYDKKNANVANLGLRKVNVSCWLGGLLQFQGDQTYALNLVKTIYLTTNISGYR